MKRGAWFILIILFVFAVNFVFSAPIENSLHLNIQVTNSSNNDSVLTGTFNFIFNISASADCSNALYTSSSSLTTDSRGGISYYLTNVNLNFTDQYWLCYYRNGILINASKIAYVPYAFMAKNVSLSGVYIDTNFGVGNYNITTTGTLSSPILCLNGDCRGVWPTGSGGSTGIYASGNNSNGYYIQFTDGTMMEWGNSMQTIISNADQDYVIIYPIAFTVSSSVSASAQPGLSWTGFYVAASFPWNVTSGIVHIRNGATAQNASINWIAQGRWTSLTNLTASSNYTWAVNPSTGNVVLFNNNVNVGIGTSTPASKLEVIGNTNITGNLTLGLGRIMYNTSSNSYIYYNTTDWIAFGTGSGIPTGAIMAFNSASCPAGWILADGTSGTPDLRGIFIRGSGTSGVLKYANGSYFNAGYGTYGNDSFQGHWHNLYGADTATGGSGFYNIPSTGITNTIRGSVGYAETELNDGTNGAPRYGTETTPAYYATIYCIKTGSDSATSNTIWATSGNNIVQNNASKNVVLNGQLTLNNSNTRVSKTNAQTLLSALGWQKINLNAIQWDSLNEFNPTNNSFVARYAGYYQINGQVMLDLQTSVLDFSVGLMKNNVTLIQGTRMSCCSPSGYPSGVVSDIQYLNAGDTINLYAYAASNASLFIDSAGYYSNYLSVHRLS